MTPQIALITGGSRGLGRSMALHLARRGVDVVLTYQSSRSNADAVVAEIQAMGRQALALPLDTRDAQRFDLFREQLTQDLRMRWGAERIRYLVNNAGVGIHKPLAETTPRDFDMLMEVHVKGVFFLVQQLAPMIEDGGRILNISSGLARFALPGYGAYAMMKGAIEVYTRYLAAELAPRRITANVVAPGAIETDFGGGVVRDNAEINAAIAGHTALGRVGLPDDIGGAVADFLTGDFAWMTAQRIEVSGGQNL